MISLLNKNLIILTISAFSLTTMAGCSNTTKPLSDSSTSSKSNTDISITPENNSSETKQQVDSEKTFLENIKKLAIQGKIINCDFPVKSTTIENLEEKLGKSDKSDWVPQAKGTYVTYSEYNVVFGLNKGSQVFEVRSFDDQLKQISLSMVKNVFGNPEHDVKSNNEEIIGYTSGQEYKILFVFPEPTTDVNDPILKHYSVLYPKGTVNIMADDPGREW